MIERLAIGAVLAPATAWFAYRAGALDRGGALAAAGIGAAVWFAGDWPAALVLFAFFIPSALLSRIGRARKRALVDVGKHGARDAQQVLANGGIAAVCILLSLRGGAPLAAAFAGALAAASADTWGTEIGTLAGGKPRSILTGATLPTGMSGGVTAAGTIAECAGAAAVALVAALLHLAPFFAVAAAGITGALLDSLLGASLQAVRYCPQCERPCETDPHVCGTSTELRRGEAWCGNDLVNLAATLGGAACAAAIVIATGR